MTGSPLTTHVLDTARGLPAKNLPIQLYFEEMRPDSRMWKHIASGYDRLSSVVQFRAETNIKLILF